MKDIAKRIFGVVCVLTALTAWAEQRESVTLSLPKDFIKKTCPVPVWKGTTVLWKGIKDAREVPEIGRQSKKKGKDAVLVDSTLPLEVFLDASLKDLLNACGVRIATDGKADVTMSGEVREFYVGVEKGLFTGKGVAKSALLFRLNRKNDATDRTVEVGYEMEAKKIRQKDLKQLEETVNELLVRTLEQIPKLDGFKDL
jgi:YajG family uncharacterized lipoprotein